MPTATVSQLFTGIQVNTFFLTEGQISRIASMWMQQMEGTDRQFQILATYSYSESRRTASSPASTRAGDSST